MSAAHEGGFAPGEQIEVRDEVWLIRNVTATEHDGDKIRAVGVGELVRDREATFFSHLEEIRRLRPEDTELVRDDSPGFRRSRLFLEAVVRKTPLPQANHKLAMADGFLLDSLDYQLRPAELALQGIRPRLLLADVVGLGKTLEIGLILAELIRRGRGDRILVVTPQQILEQFQRELWTRFSIPLVRLDSTGIQRIQRELPAGRNPFTSYKRVIISIDTLKNPDEYKHHLDQIEWDVVVIDESHSLIGGTSLRSQLAKVLAPRTDGLLLASATPHNGDKRSFADLVRLLDPAAIADRDAYQATDIKHVYIRRTKVSSDVRDQIGNAWAARGPSVPVHCAATDVEEKIFAELTETWLTDGGQVRIAGKDHRLFPYQLLKAFLSSHKALEATVRSRLGTIGTSAGNQIDTRAAEALERLHELASGVQDDDSTKLRALVEELQKLGVGPGGATRVVVFSERVPTVKWLAGTVPGRLGFSQKQAKAAIRVMHGGLPDTEALRVLEEFELAESPVRLMFTSDITSEGVNLHRQCHHLVHYDLPWSLIRIEQRNGRIDRYGQQHSPEFRALILTSQVPDAKDDRTVAEKLLHREAEAHRSLGTAESVTGLFDAQAEEDRLIRDLLHGRTVEESLEARPPRDVLDDLLSSVGGQPTHVAPERATMSSLFTTTSEFVDQAIREVYTAPERELELRRDNDERVLVLKPPVDLLRRLSALPDSYLKEQNVKERLMVTFDRRIGEQHMLRARERAQTQWPDVGYVSDLHPLVDWLVDKVLVRLDRQQAPVIEAEVTGPTFLIQGMYANRAGKPTIVEWLAVSGLPDDPKVAPMFDVLNDAEVGPDMVNRAQFSNLDELTTLLPQAVQVARDVLEDSRRHQDEALDRPLREALRRLQRWEQASLFPELTQTPQLARRRHMVEHTVDEQKRLVDRMRTSGQPYLRVLAVLKGTA